MICENIKTCRENEQEINIDAQKFVPAIALIQQFVISLLIQDSMSLDDTALRESYSSLQRIILFVPSTSCWGLFVSSSLVLDDMHGEAETGSASAGSERSLRFGEVPYHL